MKKVEFSFRSSCNECDIRYVKYIPNGRINAILQISHGMCEFIDRYDDFANYMCENGFLVVGNDHIGHGCSINTEDDWGYFYGEDGNRTLLDDIYKLTSIIKSEYSNVPYFILGHSMGSFYVRQYICEHGKEIDGAIIMGTGHLPLATLNLGMSMCKLFAMRKGWRHRSRAMYAMAFGQYNKKIPNNKTGAEWLTKDESIINRYISDPRCTFRFTLNGYYNMFLGMSRLHDNDLLNQVPKNLPILFVSGGEDPVGDYGEGVFAASNSLKNIGCINITTKIYPNDRHEILNETNKHEVYLDILNWLKKI